jgi:hypothetical protein
VGVRISGGARRLRDCVIAGRYVLVVLVLRRRFWVVWECEEEEEAEVEVDSVVDVEVDEEEEAVETLDWERADLGGR